MTINKAIAIRFTSIMNEKKISQYELSKLSTIEQSTISHILNGDTKEPKITTIIKMIEALGLTISQFFNDKIFENLEY